MHSYFSDEIYYKKRINSPIFVIGPKKILVKSRASVPLNGTSALFRLLVPRIGLVDIKQMRHVKNDLKQTRC